MKKLKITLIGLGLIGVGFASAGIRDYTSDFVKNPLQLNNRFFDENQQKVFKFQDPTSSVVCYEVITPITVYGGTISQQASISCVR